MSASYVNYESIHSALNIERLATCNTFKYETNFYFELILFLSKISVNPIVLTCYRFFAIKKLLILIIALVVIAYYFFVVHFQLIVNYIQKQVVNTSQ